MKLTDEYIKDTYGNVLTIGTVSGHPVSGVLFNGYGDTIESIEIKHGAFPATSVKVTSTVHGYSLLLGGSDIWFTRPYQNSYIRAAALGSEIRFTASNATLHDKSPITIKPNGNVLINTTIDSGYNLRVNGTLTSGSLDVDDAIVADSVTAVSLVGDGIQSNSTVTATDFIASGILDASGIRTLAPLNEQQVAEIRFGDVAASGTQIVLDNVNYIPIEINGITFKLLISL
jgi:hypothetical protein